MLLQVQRAGQRSHALFQRKLIEPPLFVARLFWPFYVLERADGQGSVVMDGLGLFNHHVTYSTVSQCDHFESDLAKALRSNISPSAYLEVLKVHATTFRSPNGAIDYSLHGYIADDGLVSGLCDYAKASPEVESLPESAALSPRISPEAASTAVCIFSQLVKETSRKDVKRLETVGNLLGEATAYWMTRVEEEQLQAGRAYSERIAHLRPEIEEAVQQRDESMREEVALVEERFAPLVADLKAEVARWESEARQWKDKGGAYAKSRSSAERARSASAGRLANVLAHRDREISRVVEHVSHLTTQEWRRVSDIEKEKDQAVQELGRIGERLTTFATQIGNDINRLISAKQAFVESMEDAGAGFPRQFDSSPRSAVMVHVPFWVAALDARPDHRLLLLLPSVVDQSVNRLGRAFRLFWQPALPVRPRTKRFEQVLKRTLQQAATTDQSLMQELMEKGLRTNVLEDRSTEATCRSGLRRLLELGRIKAHQAEEVISSLAAQPVGAPTDSAVA
ncbi:MAG: hypothetical protein HYX97_04270 [Chloroflexi bacterium]|nr:hypothetical protein [Chloroflexota bacterium]